MGADPPLTYTRAGSPELRCSSTLSNAITKSAFELKKSFTSNEASIWMANQAQTAEKTAAARQHGEPGPRGDVGEASG